MGNPVAVFRTTEGIFRAEIFVNTALNKQLDWFRWFGRTGKHPAFGEVIEGMDVVTRIECAPADAMDRPIEPIRVDRIEIHD